MSRKLSRLIADFESSLVGRMLSDNPRTEKNYKAARKALRTALSEAQQRARREALEEAAKTIEEGFDRGIASKHDMCVHKKFEWEDCEPCAANAIRALIPSEPHDAEGRE